MIRMLNSAALVAAVALGGCAAGAGQRQQGENAGEVSARLAGATYGRVPGQPVSCINVADVRVSRALSGELILFEAADGRQWVNRASSCTGLSYNRAVRLQNPTAQLCRGHTVQVTNAAGTAVYGSCTVGEFLTFVPRG